VPGTQVKRFVETVRERCRVCFTCVRECPSKAIRIRDGQAEVIAERCIGCGNCVRVCSQSAKQAVASLAKTEELLAGRAPVVLCVAPSFAAEFPGLAPEQLVGMCRAAGFAWVNEVGFGADLVADRYHKLLARKDRRRYIATSCPAAVSYVEKYLPDLVECLVPIVSPMVATARVLRAIHGRNLAVVFVGPCIAKKGEGLEVAAGPEVEAAITFAELRALFAQRKIVPDGVEPAEFDPPRAGVGGVFALSRGLLQAAQITEDLLTGDVVATDGRSNFVEALKEFHAENLDVRLLEVLACNGCIMGAGMTDEAPLFTRRARVSRYVRQRLENMDWDGWHRDMERFRDLDLSRTYGVDDQRIELPSDEALREILERMGKFKPEDQLNCGACGYDTCHEHAVAIHKGLAESEMCLPYTIKQLQRMVAELKLSHEELASTQAALMQAEKLASMGQLAAGIAHEVNNPLGIVLLYAHLLLDESGDPKVKDDLRMVVEQADRCKKIVAGLLHFARKNKVVLQPADVAELAEHTLQVLQLPDTVRSEVCVRCADTVAEIDRDQVIQVLTNLFTNACDAMPNGGSLTVTVDGDEANVLILVTDTGGGIAEDKRANIFEPFFTTKQIGKGTGLGLAVSYGIVKMHKGDISFQSNANPTLGPTGTTFKVRLPRRTVEETL